MSDMFEILSPQPNKTIHRQKNRNDRSNYIKLQAEFLTTSFGHYTLRFASMIAEQAASKLPALKSINMNKSLREIAKKYFLSDLEMVYVGHIGGLLEWNINSCSVLSKSNKMNFKVEGQTVEGQLLMFFLNLVTFFVKKYIGQLQEYNAIADYLHQQSHGQWNSVYEEWLKSCPKSMFKLSPREINLSYSRYTKNCQQSTRSKNYNHLVDQIMELSTTYAMIPGEVRENKRVKKDTKALNIFEQEIEQQKDLIEPYIFGRKIFKPDEVSQLDFNKRSDLKKFSEISNEFIDVPQSIKPKIKLGQKGNKQSQINNTVTDFFSKKNNETIVNKRYAPQSNIGFVDPNPSMAALFDSKIFSSGSEIIPYPLRSHSNLFRSKLFE